MQHESDGLVMYVVMVNGRTRHDGRMSPILVDSGVRTTNNKKRKHDFKWPSAFGFKPFHLKKDLQVATYICENNKSVCNLSHNHKDSLQANCACAV